MRILFLSQLLPYPLDAGPKIRAHYVLRYLRDAGHDVTLLCFVRPTDRQTDVDALRGVCSLVETIPLERSRVRDAWDALRSPLSSVPFLILRDQRPSMSEQLERIARRQTFDAFHVDQLWMAPYATRCATTGMRVLDQHNAVFKVPQRLALQTRNPLTKTFLNMEASRLAAFEQSILERFDQVVWVSREDRDAFVPRQLARRHDEVIPIAVDPRARRPLTRSRPFRVTFLGGLHWPPNAEGVRWFIDRVWPTVAEAAPGVVLTIIGRGAPKDLGKCHYGQRVVVEGYLRDIDRHLAETAVFVVPLLTGAGMRVKILDAWCAALPVVSTPIGAEGVEASDGENLLLGDGEHVFADSVIRVLQDQRVARRLSEGGRATVEAVYDWRKAYAAWERVYH